MRLTDLSGAHYLYDFPCNTVRAHISMAPWFCGYRVPGSALLPEFLCRAVRAHNLLARRYRQWPFVKQRPVTCVLCHVVRAHILLAPWFCQLPCARQRAEEDASWVHRTHHACALDSDWCPASRFLTITCCTNVLHLAISCRPLKRDCWCSCICIRMFSRAFSVPLPHFDGVLNAANFLSFLACLNGIRCMLHFIKGMPQWHPM